MNMQSERKGARKYWLAEDVFPDLKQPDESVVDEQNGILLMFQQMAAMQKGAGRGHDA